MTPKLGSAPSVNLPSIKLRYLLVIQIPVYVDDNGMRWTYGLWYKDLVEHLVYIEDFTLACPCMPLPADTASLVRMSEPRIKFVDLPGRHKLTLALPATVKTLWRAVGNTDVVHTGLGGWLPFSLCNLTSFMARLRRRFLFIVVESSTWRLVPGRRHSIKDRLRAVLSEGFNKYTLAHVDLAVFTQAKYKQSLMARHPQRGHVIHASWIDAAVVASAQEARQSWERKRAAGSGPVKLLFAGWLNAAKGIPVLLAAMRQLDATGAALELHVIGEGELIDDCKQAAQSLQRARLKLVEPKAYGPVFLSFLRDYHAVVVPSITDEQPRIVYDAYSQAVPVIASRTDGLRDCVQDAVTGWLCSPNDASALARLLQRAASEPDALHAMSDACLAQAHRMTHQQMHSRRLELLNPCLQAWSQQTVR